MSFDPISYALAQKAEADAQIALLNIANKNKDLLCGIVPTFDWFNTSPTNPQNATDGNEANPCGTGISIKGGAGTAGIIYFDRGAGNTSPILLDMNIGLSGNAGGVYASIYESDDIVHSTYDTMVFSNGSTIMETMILAAAEVKVMINPVMIHSRFIKILFTASGALTLNNTIYEIMGYSLTP
jgi:hypothetical protein